MASLNHPDSLKYSKSDEWVRVEGAEVVVGITDYAQDQLGSIVYVDFAGGNDVSFDESFGNIESVKSTSELYSPVTGEIVSVNEELAENPQLVNDDPYDKGWMLRVKLSDAAELDKLMSAEEYIQYLQGR